MLNLALIIHSAIVFGTLLVAVFLGWGITALILRLANVRNFAAPVPRAKDGTSLLLDDENLHQPLLRGGLWIGILERLAIAVCVLGGHPELISLVVAVKGLGRYPELHRNPEAAERFLIGTAASMLSAVAIGLLGRYLLTL